MLDASFQYRLAAGLTFFALLGLWDYVKYPENPKRLKEYLFLFGITGLVIFYGVLHDFVTWSISRDYYVVGKGIPSAAEAFDWAVVKLAMQATWTVGLIGTVILLLTNNPDAQGRQVPYPRLLKFCLIPLMTSIVCESIFATGFYFQSAFMRDYLPVELLVYTVDDAFVVVWGMHLGAYIGAGLGVLIAVIKIIHGKRTLTIEGEAKPKD